MRKMRPYLIGLFFVFAGGGIQAENDANKVADINARLERLERAMNNQALIDMLNQLQSLKLEISTLRGEIEVQTHTIAQLKQKQRQLYTDIDRRLLSIESNEKNKVVSSATNTPNPIDQQPPDSDSPADSVSDITINDDITDNAEKTEKTVVTEMLKDQKPLDPLQAKSVYQHAFKLLQKSQYDQASKAFRNFLKHYPDSAFSDNAQYWLGEAHYIMQQYQLAINEYQALLNAYPDSKKVPGSLLKIGFSYAKLGNATEAKKTLQNIITQFPETTVARLADERLRKINATTE